MTSSETMTKAQLDAGEMTALRRQPLPRTEHTEAYLRLMREVREFQDALVCAQPSTQQLGELADTVAAVREVLDEQWAPEAERLYGRGEMSASDGQCLVPVVSIDFVDNAEFRGRTRFGEFFMGVNSAVHGGEVSVVFDTVLGRLSMGEDRSASRTAYLTTSYRNITPINQELQLRAWVDQIDGRKRFLKGQLLDGDVVCAEAEALFIEVKPGQQ